MSKRVWTGMLLALAIGAATVAGSSLLARSMGGDMVLREEWPVLLFQALLASAPFLALVFARVRTMLPWAIGLLVTLSFWGVFLASVQFGDGGVNIGMSLLMLTSPFFVAVASFAAWGFQKRT